MIERAVAAWEQLLLSQSSDETAIHTPFGKFGPIPPAAQFCLPAAFPTTPMRVLGYISEAVQDRSDGPGGRTLLHRFCTAAQMEMILHVIKDLVAESAAKKIVPLLETLIVAALLSFDRSLMQPSRLTPIVGEDLNRKCS